MLKISCFIKDKNAVVGLSFRWLMTPWKDKNNPSDNDSDFNTYFLYKKLSPIFSCYEEWLLIQPDCPAKGHIGSAKLTRDDMDENGIFKANTILNQLKESYGLSIHCRQISSEDLNRDEGSKTD